MSSGLESKLNLLGSCGCTNLGDVCYCPTQGVIQTLSRKYSLAIIGLIGNHGRMRFNAIMDHFQGMSPKTLTDRLRELEEAGFLLRHTFSEIPPRVEYSLTAKGRETRELIKPFMEWVSRESMKLTQD